MNEELIIIICTFPDLHTARDAADVLLENKLAACVSITAPLESHFIWQGKVEHAEEYMMLIKTEQVHFYKIQETITAMHPYDVPELVALSASASAPYLAWLRSSIS